jgi:hypothetical protein
VNQTEKLSENGCDPKNGTKTNAELFVLTEASKQHGSSNRVLACGLLLGVIFCLEDGGSTFVRSV